MSGVDLNVFRFDFDLTFAALLMNADGTIYHRFGNRGATDPMSHVSMPSFVKLLRETLEDHRKYQKNPSTPKKQREKKVDDLWQMAKKPKKPECFHCHMIGEAERSIARAENLWSPTEIWKWPMPERIGLSLEKEDQTLISEIASASAARKAGLKKGDRLTRMNDTRVRTQSDVQWVLDQLPDGKATVTVEVERKKKRLTRELRLPKGWKITDPLDVAWRSTIWGYTPAPGFGGPKLKPEELRKLGLPPNIFAFRINYIVDWNENKRFGNNAKKAGLQKKDVVYSVNGKNDFQSMQHFHAWFRLTQTVGSSVVLQTIRGKQKRKVILPVIP